MWLKNLEWEKLTFKFLDCDCLWINFSWYITYLTNINSTKCTFTDFFADFLDWRWRNFEKVFILKKDKKKILFQIKWRYREYFYLYSNHSLIRIKWILPHDTFMVTHTSVKEEIFLLKVNHFEN